MTIPTLGSRWRHKKSKRDAVVVSSYRSGRIILFRYESASSVSRGHGQMRPRTNTTSQMLSRFLKAFEEITELTPAQLEVLVLLKDEGPLKDGPSGWHSTRVVEQLRNYLDTLERRQLVEKIDGAYSIIDAGRKAFFDASPSCAQSMGTLCAHHSAGFRTWKDPCNANEVRS